MRKLDLTGHTYGRLTVKHAGPSKAYPNGKVYRTWLCQCLCGARTTVLTVNLRSGRTTSCGCARGGLIRHGMSRAREHAIWRGIKSRCFNARTKNYQRYGGRGITMCNAWRDSFEQFFLDMGPCPEGHSIEREDNNGNYEPGNCVWAPAALQSRNRRNTLRAEDGETLAEIAERRGVKYSTLRRAVQRGEDPYTFVPRRPR